MAFWDNLSQKASETTAKAMQKAKEMSDVAKLNAMISEEEAKSTMPTIRSVNSM